MFVLHLLKVHRLLLLFFLLNWSKMPHFMSFMRSDQLASSRGLKRCLPTSKTTSTTLRRFCPGLRNGGGPTPSPTTTPTSLCVCPSCWTPSLGTSCWCGTRWKWVRTSETLRLGQTHRGVKNSCVCVCVPGWWWRIRKPPMVHSGGDVLPRPRLWGAGAHRQTDPL